MIRQRLQPDGRLLVRSCNSGFNVAPPSGKVLGPFELVAFFGLGVACDRLLQVVVWPKIRGIRERELLLYRRHAADQAAWTGTSIVVSSGLP